MQTKTELNKKTGQIEQKVLIGADYISAEELAERYGNLITKFRKQQEKGFKFIMNFIMHDEHCPEIPNFKSSAERLKWYKNQLEV